MSTRKLIIAALLCGLAILIAFTVKMTTVISNGSSAPTQFPPGLTSTVPGSTTTSTSADPGR